MNDYTELEPQMLGAVPFLRIPSYLLRMYFCRSACDVKSWKLLEVYQPRPSAYVAARRAWRSSAGPPKDLLVTTRKMGAAVSLLLAAT